MIHRLTRVLNENDYAFCSEQEKANVINYDFVKRINAPFQNPDLVIYLRIPVSVSVERATLIGRPESYSTDYLYKVKDFMIRRAKIIPTM